MKKVFRTGTLSELQTKAAPNEQFIASRSGKSIWIQNLEFDKNIEIKADGGVLHIKVNLKDGDFLSIGDLQGVAEKKVLL